MSENIIAGLDIGTKAIRVAMGQTVPGEGARPRVHIVGAVEVPSEGIHKGTITSMEDAVSALSKSLEMAERMTGVPLSSAWVGIAGNHILVQETKGVIGVGRTDGEIKEEDVERAIEAARTVSRPTNYEILHIIPKAFNVDGQAGIKDPVGMNGIRLEVDAVVIQGLSSQIKNITKCIYRTGLDIEDLVYAPLASAEVVTTQRQKELGVCVVNMGASTTTLILFEEGDIKHTAVLPVGSDHVTNDIAIGLRTALDVAEAIKMKYGHAIADDISKKDLIDLAEFGAQGEEPVERKYVAEIIQARVEEIVERIDAELAKVDRSGMLPAGVIVTGGGAKLSGLLDIMKRMLRLPATFGDLHNITSVVENATDPSFSTAVGLVLWGAEVRSSAGGRMGGMLAPFKSIDKVTAHVRKWFKSLIP